MSAGFRRTRRRLAEHAVIVAICSLNWAPLPPTKRLDEAFARAVSV